MSYEYEEISPEDYSDLLEEEYEHYDQDDDYEYVPVSLDCE